MMSLRFGSGSPFLLMLRIQPEELTYGLTSRIALMILKLHTMSWPSHSSTIEPMALSWRALSGPDDVNVQVAESAAVLPTLAI